MRCDPDTGAWISDAEATEIAYSAFGPTPRSDHGRLVVRRFNDARFPDAPTKLELVDAGPRWFVAALEKND